MGVRSEETCNLLVIEFCISLSVSAADLELITPGHERIVQGVSLFTATSSEELDNVHFFLDDEDLGVATKKGNIWTLEFDTYDYRNGFYYVKAVSGGTESEEHYIRIKNDRSFVEAFIEETKQMSDRKGGFVLGAVIFFAVLILFGILFTIMNTGSMKQKRKNFKLFKKKPKPKIHEDTFEPEIKSVKKEDSVKKEIKEDEKIIMTGFNKPNFGREKPNREEQYSEIDRLLESEGNIFNTDLINNVNEVIRQDNDEMITNEPAQTQIEAKEDHIHEDSLQELRNYIEQARANAAPDDLIREQLRTNGWPEDVINKYLS